MRSTATFRAAAVGALLYACLGLACKKPTPPADEAGSSKNADAKKAKPQADDDEADPEAAADDALGEKLDLYIRDCLNVFSRGLYDSRTRYSTWVDPKKGPTGKERFVYGLYKINGDVEKCTKSVKSAAGKKPSDEKLESAASAYETAIAAAVPLINDAYKYYDQKDYSDDAFAKAKELHPKLISAWDAFAKADKELGDRVEALQMGLQKRDLARLEKSDGKRARWHTKNTLLLGKALVKEADGDFDRIDAAAYQSALDAYLAAIDAFEKWREAHKSDRNASDCSSYFSESQDVVKAGKALGRRIKDKKPFNAYEKSRLGTQSGWSIEGSPDALFHEWGEVIRMYNSIHWSR